MLVLLNCLAGSAVLAQTNEVDALLRRFGANDELIALDHSFIKHHSNREWAAAAGIGEQLLAMAENQFGRLGKVDHPIVLTYLPRLAECYAQEEQYAKAEPLYRRMVAFYEFTKQPSEQASSLVRLGDMLRNQRRYSESEASLKRSINILTKLYGPKNFALSEPLISLSFLYLMQGKQAELENVKRQLDSILKK